MATCVQALVSFINVYQLSMSAHFNYQTNYLGTVNLI